MRPSSPRASPSLSPLAAGLLLCAALAACGPDSDPPGDPLTFRLEGVVCPGFPSVPWHVSWSPDGRWIVLADGWHGPDLRIVEARSMKVVARQIDVLSPTNIKGRESAKLPWHERSGQAATFPPRFSSDSRSFLLDENDELVQLRLEDGKWSVAKRVPFGFTPHVYFPRPNELIYFEDSGKVLLAHDDKAKWVSLVDGAQGVVPTDRPVHRLLSAPDGSFFCMDYSTVPPTSLLLNASFEVTQTVEEGAILAVSNDGRLWLVDVTVRSKDDPTGWEGPTHLELWQHPGPRIISKLTIGSRDTLGKITQAAFSPDGALLAIGEEFARVVLRETSTGRVTQVIRNYEEDRIVHLAFSPDSRHLITGGRPNFSPEPSDRNKGILHWRRNGFGR